MICSTFLNNAMVTVPGLPQVAGPAKVATQVAAGRWLGALTKKPCGEVGIG